MALMAAVVIAVFVVQFTVVKSGLQGTMVNDARVVIRIPQPLPEVAGQVAAGDHLYNGKGELIGTITSAKAVTSKAGTIPMTWSNDQDLVVTADVKGDMRLVRDLPGFSKEPASLRAGVWCLLTTTKVELSGMITHVAPLAATTEAGP